MNRQDVETGKLLLKECGPIQMVLAVSAPDMIMDPNEVGCVLENKAKGNETYGYFEPRDDDEAPWPELLCFLSNHAEAMLACADVAIEGHIIIPMLDLSEKTKPPPHLVGVLLQVVGHLCKMHSKYPEDTLSSKEFKPAVIELLRQQGLPYKISEDLLRNAGYYQ